jgi:hypothetical protein
MRSVLGLTAEESGATRMRRLSWSSRLVALATIWAFLVSGCGDQDAGTSASTSGTTPAGGSGSGTATSVPGGSDTGIPTPPTETGGESVPVVTGEVSVTLGAGHYPVGAVIEVTVANGLDRPILTEDFKTACSIVVLQRRDGDTWTDILGCRLGRPTATVEIGPELGQRVELDPASSHLTGTGGPAFGTGSYRVAFTYRLEPGAGGGNPAVAYSAEFPIK